MNHKWKKANGSCGYNVDAPVFGKRYRNRSMFAWENKNNGFWTVSIIG